MKNIERALKNKLKSKEDNRLIVSGEELTLAIVIQNTTFHGLENVVKCVDAHLKHLQSLDNINECAQYLLKEIELKRNFRNYKFYKIIKL